MQHTTNLNSEHTETPKEQQTQNADQPEISPQGPRDHEGSAYPQQQTQAVISSRFGPIIPLGIKSSDQMEMCISLLLRKQECIRLLDQENQSLKFRMSSILKLSEEKQALELQLRNKILYLQKQIGLNHQQMRKLQAQNSKFQIEYRKENARLEQELLELRQTHKDSKQNFTIVFQDQKAELQKYQKQLKENQRQNQVLSEKIAKITQDHALQKQQLESQFKLINQYQKQAKVSSLQIHKLTHQLAQAWTDISKLKDQATKNLKAIESASERVSVQPKEQTAQKNNVATKESRALGSYSIFPKHKRTVPKVDIVQSLNESHTSSRVINCKQQQTSRNSTKVNTPRKIKQVKSSVVSRGSYSALKKIERRSYSQNRGKQEVTRIFKFLKKQVVVMGCEVEQRMQEISQYVRECVRSLVESVSVFINQQRKKTVSQGQAKQNQIKILRKQLVEMKLNILQNKVRKNNNKDHYFSTQRH